MTPAWVILGDTLKDFVEEVIKEAGEIISQKYTQTFKVQAKGSRDVVTEVDKSVEKFISQKIKEKFPEHAILGEESGKYGESDSLWIIDPLDGTKNFVTHTPFFNIAIAYLEKGEPVLAMVYNPITKELFYAEKGKGALLNGESIHVSETDKLLDSSVYFCRGLTEKALERSAKFYSKLIKETRSLRQMGSAELELCYVAAGRIEAFYISDLHIWDAAAGWLIVKEAGGKVTNFKDEPFSLSDIDILASNNKIHKELLENLK